MTSFISPNISFGFLDISLASIKWIIFPTQNSKSMCFPKLAHGSDVFAQSSGRGLPNRRPRYYGLFRARGTTPPFFSTSAPCFWRPVERSVEAWSLDGPHVSNDVWMVFFLGPISKVEMVDIKNWSCVLFTSLVEFQHFSRNLCFKGDVLRSVGPWGNSYRTEPRKMFQWPAAFWGQMCWNDVGNRWWKKLFVQKDCLKIKPQW